jgi:hypothetical protein
MDYRALVEILEEKGLQPMDYSGRGMYGAHCVAVVLESPAHIALLGPELFDGLHVDHMAMEFVAYWPNALVQ